MTVPFISSADLSDQLGQDVTSSDLAIIAIDSACEIVRSYLDQYLNLVESDEVTLDGTGTYSLLLPQRPVVAVNSVEIADEADPEFYLDDAGILYRTDGVVWTKGHGNVTVDYDHGYAFHESDVDGARRMPSDIRRVALELASRIWVSQGTQTGQVESETIGSYSYTNAPGSSGGASALLDEERITLDHYLSHRRP
jgi:hypothetical protein